MIITEKGERARELFLSGYTCAQATAAVFADEAGMPEETIMKLALPFGGGMGRLREVCGAFSGIVLVVGMIFGDAIPGCPNKAAVYTVVQELAQRFKAEYDTLICRELLENFEKADTDPKAPSERTPEFYDRRPCPRICAVAASILENYLNERKNSNLQ